MEHTNFTNLLTHLYQLVCYVRRTGYKEETKKSGVISQLTLVSVFIAK
jgi:hypothetical protein